MYLTLHCLVTLFLLHNGSLVQVEHPQRSKKMALHKVLSKQRKRAVVACLRMAPLYNLPRYKYIIYIWMVCSHKSAVSTQDKSLFSLPNILHWVLLQGDNRPMICHVGFIWSFVGVMFSHSLKWCVYIFTVWFQNEHWKEVGKQPKLRAIGKVSIHMILFLNE